MINPKTILFVGGGTGGPTLPLVAVAEQIHLSHPDYKLVLVLDKASVVPKEVLPSYLELRVAGAVKLPRYLSFSYLFLPWRMWRAWKEARAVLQDLRPSVTVGTGSYVQVPFVRQGRKFGVKSHLHQQDIVPTLSNTLSKKFADSFSVSFPKSLADFPHATVTGNPVRALSSCSQSEAQEKLGLQPGTWILVMGGGSGAMAINQLLAENLVQLSSNKIGVLHITGKNSLNLPPDNPLYKRFEFYSDMGLLYSAVSLVVCRSGASTIAELSQFQLPSVQVPIPRSHQEENAAFVKESGAGVVFNQDQEAEISLAQTVVHLLSNPGQLSSMREQSGKLNSKDAASNIASKVLELVQTHGH